MNIFVNMSVMRLSSEPDSILQESKITEVLTGLSKLSYHIFQISRILAGLEHHLPSRKKHWRPMRPSFLSAQCVDAQLAMMSVMSLIRKCICNARIFWFCVSLERCVSWTMNLSLKRWKIQISTLYVCVCDISKCVSTTPIVFKNVTVINTYDLVTT